MIVNALFLHTPRQLNHMCIPRFRTICGKCGQIVIGHPSREAVAESRAVLSGKWLVKTGPMAGSQFNGAVSTNSNLSLQGQQCCPLCRAKTAPLGENRSSVQLEIGSVGEAVILIDIV
jgi:hypothetical protein